MCFYGDVTVDRALSSHVAISNPPITTTVDQRVAQRDSGTELRHHATQVVTHIFPCVRTLRQQVRLQELSRSLLARLLVKRASPDQLPQECLDCN